MLLVYRAIRPLPPLERGNKLRSRAHTIMPFTQITTIRGCNKSLDELKLRAHTTGQAPNEK